MQLVEASVRDKRSGGQEHIAEDFRAECCESRDSEGMAQETYDMALFGEEDGIFLYEGLLQGPKRREPRILEETVDRLSSSGVPVVPAHGTLIPIDVVPDADHQLKAVVDLACRCLVEPDVALSGAIEDGSLPTDLGCRLGNIGVLVYTGHIDPYKSETAGHLAEDGPEVLRTEGLARAYLGDLPSERVTIRSGNVDSFAINGVLPSTPRI